MFRKLILAVATVAALGGTATLTSTPAAAHGWHGGGHHGGWHHRGWGGPRFYYGGPAYAYGGGGGCYVRRLVQTPWGLRWRTVNRCY